MILEVGCVMHKRLNRSRCRFGCGFLVGAAWRRAIFHLRLCVKIWPQHVNHSKRCQHKSTYDRLKFIRLAAVAVHAGAGGHMPPNCGCAPPPKNLAVVLTHCGQMILSRYVILDSLLDLRLWLTGPPMHDYWSRDFFLLPFLRCDVVVLGCVVLICFVELSFIFVIYILLLKKSGCVVFLECSAPSSDRHHCRFWDTAYFADNTASQHLQTSVCTFCSIVDSSDGSLVGKSGDWKFTN